jgi:hypothetical protein
VIPDHFILRFIKNCQVTRPQLFQDVSGYNKGSYSVNMLVNLSEILVNGLS